MYYAGNKAGKILVQEDFSIHTDAEAECRGEDMHLFSSRLSPGRGEAPTGQLPSQYTYARRGCVPLAS